MRQVYVTHEPWPASAEVIAAAGGVEILHTTDMAAGLHQIPGPEDDPSARCSEVDTLRDQVIDGGFTFNGIRYQTRPEDRANIAGAAQAATLAIISGFQPGNLRWANANADFGWISEDNTVVPMDAFDVVAFFRAGAAFKTAAIFHAKGLKDSIRAGGDPDISEGWPG